ncbi:MAG TPA: SH3 domain-containing protein [Actinophytocola sp.]|uniref:SH3 domain-containing protein n=1 Tax=Actinophytocola sp. TaxID=1872138 RepID=UPI002DB6183E|nr:SH3 domain-containing protein [Actinophytocola sp.]HEU5473914.1 SH3 domain-containing protein [Actinophytocola sp.]
MAKFPKRPLLLGGGLVAVVALYVMGSDGQNATGSQPSDDPNQCQITVTADVLRVRAGPGTDTEIVGRLTRGQQADAEQVVQNGFRKLAENRWVSAEFAQPVPGRPCG